MHDVTSELQMKDYSKPFIYIYALPEIIITLHSHRSRCLSKGVVAQWCNPLTLQPAEQSGRQGSIPGGDPPLEYIDKGLRSR